MAMLSDSPSGPGHIIPQEICGLICQDSVLTQPDLYALSLVSRAFREEAQRLLYISVKLGSKRNIKSFCGKIIAYPYLIEPLDKLVIHMPPQGDLQVNELSRIMKMLHLCTNLKHLHVLHDGPEWMQNKAGKAMQAWILNGHAFKLKTFVTSYFSELVLDLFLVNQPTIEILIVESEKRMGVQWSFSLPRLRKLSCSTEVMQTLTKIPGGQDIKLEQLHLTFVKLLVEDEWEMLNLLKYYRKTLKSLSITRYRNEVGMATNVFIHTIAESLPDIKFLRIIDLTRGKTTYNSQLFSLHCNFTKIPPLILHPPMMNYDNIDRNPTHMISAYPDLWTAQGQLHIATRIMHALPTLTRFVLVERELSEFTRDDVTLIAQLSTPSMERDPYEWPKYINTIASYEELWKSQWSH